MDGRPALVGAMERRGRLSWLDKLLRRRQVPVATTMLDGFPSAVECVRESMGALVVG